MNSHPSFEIFEEIGRGDDTVVYRAHDLDLGRDVAIKELQETAQADPQRLERFLKEARFLAQAEHAGVLRVYSVDSARRWIVMELMRGNLEGMIQQKALPPDTARSVLTQLLSALEFLHGQGKLHGAIRPSNVLIDDHGTVKLSDFEETDVQGELRAPKSGKKYLAPEFIRSEFGEVGFQADLYCLAITVLELLAGPRFDTLTIHARGDAIDPDVAWLRWHSGETPLPAVRSLIPGLPDDLAAALDAMLVKSVAERCTSASAARQLLNDQAVIAIQALAASEVDSPESRDSDPIEQAMLPAAVREIEPPRMTKGPSAAQVGQPTKPTRNRPQGRPLAAPKATSGQGKVPVRQKANELLSKPYVLYSVCAVLLFGAIAIGLLLQGPKQSTQVAKKAEIGGGTSSSQTSEQSSDLDTDDLSSDDLQPPETDVPSAGMGNQQEEDSLDDSDDSDNSPPASESSDELELADDADHTGSDADVNDEELNFAVEKPETEVEAESLADNSDNRESDLNSSSELDVEPLVDVDESSDTTEDLLIEPDPAEYISPLAGLVSIEVDTQPLLDEYQGEAELVIDSGGFMTEVTDVAISSDGRWVAASGDKVVRVWDATSGTLLHTLRGDRSRAAYGNCHSIDFSNDGEYLVVGVNDYRPHGSVRVYRTDNLDKIETLLPGQQAPVRHVAFSRDDQYLSCVDSNGTLYVWDWKSRELIDSSPARDPDQPIYDSMLFPDSDSTILAIDYAGPFLMSVPNLKQLTARDPLSPQLMGWMSDLFSERIEYPLETTQQPRIMDLRLETGVWAAAGVGKRDAANVFWIGVWETADDSISEGTTPGDATLGSPQPTVTYAGHRWEVTAIDIQPAAGLAISGDKFGEVHVWDLRTAEIRHKLTAQGEPIYEGALDKSSKLIGFGTRPNPKSRWGHNDYGDVRRALDLEHRIVMEIDQASDFTALQEQPNHGTTRLRVKTNPQDRSSQSLERIEGDQSIHEYRLTSGRQVSVFSLLESGPLGIEKPVLLGDNLGLLAVWDSATDELRRAFVGHQGMVTALSHRSGSDRFLSASADRTLRLWSLDDYQPTGIFDFKFENSVVTYIPESSESAGNGVRVGDKILSVSDMSMTDVQELMLAGEFEYPPGSRVTMQMQRGEQTYSYELQLVQGYDFSEPLLSIYLGNSDSWIVWTPAGYYDASPGADRLIGFHVNRGPDKSAAYFEAQQFRKQLYRPDIINRIWNGQTVDEAVAEANREADMQYAYDFRSPSDIARHHPPEIRFLSPDRNAVLDSPVAAFQAEVESANGLPIQEVTLLVNEVAAKVFTPATPTTTRMDLQTEVQLLPGRNSLELIAANRESQSSSQAIYVTTNVRPPAEEQLPKLNVLSIGISRYATSNDGFDPLPTAATDAIEFGKLVNSQGAGRLYREVSLRVLSDGQATRSAILDGLQWLVDQTEDGDTAMVYLSGHTFIDSSDNYYLGSYEVDVLRPRATAVSWREFIQTLHEDLPRCRRVVFLDLYPTPSAVNPNLRNPLLDLAAPEMATNFFSSNSLQQSQLPQADSPIGFLIDALRKTISDPDSDVHPHPPDSLLSATEIAGAWPGHVKSLSVRKLYPIAFTPETHQQANIFELVRPVE